MNVGSGRGIPPPGSPQGGRDDTIGSAGFASDVQPAWGSGLPGWADDFVALVSSGQFWLEASESELARLAVAFEDWRVVTLEFAEAGGSARDLILSGYVGPGGEAFKEQAERLLSEGKGLYALAELAHARALQLDGFARATQYAKLMINAGFRITVAAIAVTGLVSALTAGAGTPVVGVFAGRFRAFVDKVFEWLGRAAGRSYGVRAVPARQAMGAVGGEGLLARAVTGLGLRAVPAEVGEGLLADYLAQSEQLRLGTRTSWDTKMTAATVLGDAFGAVLAGKVARPVGAVVGRIPGISALSRVAGDAPGIMNALRRYPEQALRAGVTNAVVAVPAGMAANGVIYGQISLPTGESLLGSMVSGAVRANTVNVVSLDAVKALLQPSAPAYGTGAGGAAVPTMAQTAAAVPVASSPHADGATTVASAPAGTGMAAAPTGANAPSGAGPSIGVAAPSGTGVAASSGMPVATPVVSPSAMPPSAPPLPSGAPTTAGAPASSSPGNTGNPGTSAHAVSSANVPSGAVGHGTSVPGAGAQTSPVGQPAVADPSYDNVRELLDSTIHHPDPVDAPHPVPGGPRIELIGLEAGVSDRITSAMQGLGRDYESAYRQLGHIRSEDLSDVAAAHGLDAYATTGNEPGLHFDAGALNERATVPELGAGEEVSGWTVPGGGTVEGVVHHEFGHHLAAQLLDDPIARGDLNLAVLGILGTHERPFRDAVEVNLSTYGATSTQEMIAEAFTEYRLAESPRPLARAIGEVIDRHYLHVPDTLPLRWTEQYGAAEPVHARMRMPYERALRLEQEHNAAARALGGGHLGHKGREVLDRYNESKREVVAFLEEMRLDDVNNWRRFRDSFERGSETRIFYTAQVAAHFKIPLSLLNEDGPGSIPGPAEGGVRLDGGRPGFGTRPPPVPDAPAPPPSWPDPFNPAAPPLQPPMVQSSRPDPFDPPTVPNLRPVAPGPYEPTTPDGPAPAGPDDTMTAERWRQAAEEARRVDGLPFKPAMDGAAALIDRYDLRDPANWRAFQDAFDAHDRAEFFIRGQVSQRFGIPMGDLAVPQDTSGDQAKPVQAAPKRPAFLGGEVSEARRIAQIFVNNPVGGMARATREAMDFIEQHDLGDISKWRELKGQLRSEQVNFFAGLVHQRFGVSMRKLYADPTAHVRKEQELRDKKVTHEEWRRGHDNSFLNRQYNSVTFHDHTRGVFRPDDGGDRSVREVTGYRYDQWLGFGHVPTTTTWNNEGKNGTMQDEVPYLREVRSPDDYSEQHQEEIAVRHYLFGHTDGNWGNLAKVGMGQPVEVDFEHAFPASTERPIMSDFVARWISDQRPLSPRMKEILDDLDPADARAVGESGGLEGEALTGVLDRLREMREKGRITGEAWGGGIRDSKGNVIPRGRPRRPIVDDDDFGGPVFDAERGVWG